ncbi:hypothetical protein D3C75_1129270 [compost metagenome]
MTWSAPSASRRAILASDEVVAITRAPMDLAICKAKMETPPVPSTNTVLPAWMRPSTTNARQAVRPAVVSVAASSWV